MSQSRIDYILEFAGDSNVVVPTPDDETLVRRSILDVEQELRDYDAEILRIQALRAQRAICLEKLHRAIAPHKKLPLEILTKIFIHSLSELAEDVLEIPRSLSLYRGPWRFRQVCSSWRQAALSCSQLWSDIRVTCGAWTHRQVSEEEWKRRLHCASYVLPVSGPLRIEVRVGPEQSAVLPGYSIRELIVPYSFRLTELTLKFNLMSGFAELFALPGSFPLLSSLELHHLAYARDHHDYDATVASYQQSEVFSPSPQLQYLELVGKCLFRSLNRNFPWTQINTLTLDAITSGLSSASWTEMISILGRCDNLEDCCIRFGGHDNSETDDSFNTPPHPVTLPRLKKLTLNLHHSREQFITMLHLPSLKELIFENGAEDIFEYINSLIARSSCTLERFIEPLSEWDIVTIRRPPFIQFLQLLPTVRELQNRTILDQPVLDLIADGDLLPNLEVFRCHFAMSPLDFVDTLQRRFVRRGQSWGNKNHTAIRVVQGLFNDGMLRTNRNRQEEEARRLAVMEEYDVDIEIQMWLGISRHLAE